MSEKSTSLLGTLEGRWASPAPGRHSGTQAGAVALPSSTRALQIVPGIPVSSQEEERWEHNWGEHHLIYLLTENLKHTQM